MEILIFGILTLGILYISINLLIHIGLRRPWPRCSIQPEITVLVAARDEAENLPFCLEHLAAQLYPREKLQIMILNDRSLDATGDIARTYTKRFNFMEVFDIRDDKPGLKGKMNVIAQGMEKARGEIILITDADCRPSPQWISNMVSFFSEKTAMVGGLTWITGAGFFAQIQTCDWLFLQSIASGVAGLGLPVSILGNNFAFRRSIYKEIGGFEKTGFSLTEDLTLLQAMSSKKDYQIAYPLLAETLVRSRALTSPSALIHQRLRWIAGGRRSGARGLIMLIITFGLHLLLPPALLFYPGDVLLWLMTVLVILLDFGLLARLARRLSLWQPILYFPLFEIYYFFYTSFFGILSLLRIKIRWKNRIYTQN